MGRFLLIVTMVGCLTLCMARVSAAPLASPTATPVGTAAPLPGWPGDAAQYLGRYRLTASNNARMARRGQLTVFMRTIRPGVPLVMSGILALRGKSASNVFYLTQFVYTGGRMEATVQLGSYAGPQIGQFVVKQIKGKTMTAGVTIQGAPRLTLKLFRFSKNPHP